MYAQTTRPHLPPESTHEKATPEEATPYAASYIEAPSPVIKADLSNGRSGFDYFSASFTVAKPDPWSWMETRRRPSWSRRYRSMLYRSVPVRDGLVDMSSGRIPDSDDWWGAIDFVPSLVVDPTSSRLCSFIEWPGVLNDVLDETFAHLTPLVDVDQFRLRRVDVSRDFDGVRDFAPYAHAALVRPMRYATRKDMWTNGGPTPQSVYAGTRHAGHDLLYDRHARHPEVVPDGRVRIEVRGLEGWLGNARIVKLGDLTTDSALAFLAERWEWFGGNVPIVGQDRFLDAADALVDDDGSGWSTAKKERFLGHMWKASRGVAPPIPSARNAEYVKAIARTGIYLDRGLTGTDLDPAWERRLDFASGYEICDIVAHTDRHGEAA